MKKSKIILSLLLMYGISVHLEAQVALAPSFVFIDENNGVGNVFVSNNGEKAYEVTVSFAFGYPGSDADGNMVMNYGDSVANVKYALDPMIRAFPRSFILNKGEQRTVRVQVLPEQRRKEGFYFTRMKVLAKPQSADITDTVTSGIGTRINYNFEQITAVFYHKGKVNTGVEVKEINTRQIEGLLEIRPLLQRVGNAPFLGSMFAKLKDVNGKVVSETQSTTTVYFVERRHMDLKLKDVNPGTYTLELSLETKRTDMSSSDLIQSPRILEVKTIDIK